MTNLPAKTDQPTEKDQLAAIQKELKRQLDNQEIQFIRYYVGLDPVEGNGKAKGNITEAMRAAGYEVKHTKGGREGDDKSLSNRGKLILKRAGSSLELCMFSKGIDGDAMASLIKDGLAATRPIALSGGKDKASTIIDTVDYGERRKMLELTAKMMGLGTHKSVHMHHTIEDVSPQLPTGKGGLYRDEEGSGSE